MCQTSRYSERTLQTAQSQQLMSNLPMFSAFQRFDCSNCLLYRSLQQYAEFARQQVTDDEQAHSDASGMSPIAIHQWERARK